MKLCARQVAASRPMVTPYKMTDGGGLYLEVNTNGSKAWRMKYRFGGKEKRLSFGMYPLVSLADAPIIFRRVSHEYIYGSKKY
ncbi:TPA: DUF4102 domain-containing protein [Providencia rettgeri]|uniref:DUF4102 domain-containing protein n=1 Tax=Providencia rettgeri TaxID=587 RepID=A0A427HBA3_PRORE|nr:DUF4102 domain-containing protein [Providencia stuartii]ELR5219753.1 DUF4102 domain-containing protein [Providencia rettgeri]MBV2188809.1 Arm DNA-binding domain-containing protein [Providencia rettgeri]HEC8325584.1 DUF4102 domain-containing protein [Providencia rettgeri]